MLPYTYLTFSQNKVRCLKRKMSGFVTFKAIFEFDNPKLRQVSIVFHYNKDSRNYKQYFFFFKF